MSDVATLASERKRGRSPDRAPEKSGSPIRTLLKQSAEDWGVSEKVILLICSMPVVFTAIAVVCALIGKDAYKWWTGEDQFGENLQVLFWVVSLGLCLVFIKNKLREGDNIFAALYMILGLGIFFIIGEEISWGQRIFGWITPESVKQINKQGETNIHNIHGIGSTIKWIHMIVGAYGTFLPIIVMKSKALARFRAQLSMLVPPIALVPYFAFIFLWRSFRNLFDVPKKFYFVVSEFTEVTELALSLAFALFLWYHVRKTQCNKSAAKPGHMDLNRVETN
ncbi:hypothetical protein MJD09_26630 [bacterium]|nr:hypothetical protein [bacterium]